MQGFAGGGGVAVGEAVALDQEDGEESLGGVDPALGAEGAAVAVAAGGEAFGRTLGGLDDADAVAPGAAGDEAGLQVAGVGAGHFGQGFGADDAFAVERPLVEQALIEFGEVVAGAEESAGGDGVAGGGGVIQDAAGGRHELAVFFAVGDGQPPQLLGGRIGGGVD